MKIVRIAVTTVGLGPSVKASLPVVASMGADGLHIDARNVLRPTDLSQTGRREFLHQLEQLGLSVASLSFPVRRTYFDQDQLEARIAGTKAAMEFAWQLKARVLTLRIGRIPEDETSVEYEILREVMNDLARHGNHIGVIPAVTPMRDSPESLQRFVQSVTAGPLGIDFDPAGFITAGYNPGEAFRQLHKSIMQVLVRDALRDMDGGGREVPVGRGEVDWEELLALLDEADYRGWFTVDRTQGEDRQRDVAHAVQYIRRVGMGG